MCVVYLRYLSAACVIERSEAQFVLSSHDKLIEDAFNSGKQQGQEAQFFFPGMDAFTDDSTIHAVERREQKGREREAGLKLTRSIATTTHFGSSSSVTNATHGH